ncbi:ParA family protein [Paraburkholderia phytofirmans]|uniref:ParA family protein n=1 Tax=Paraburkholderia phytofirmans TaxID=261302 RepID=UPI0038BB2A20
MKSVAMFNNKGGVGKTTLTCNLASFIATEFNLRVLVVDCDPQCNATQLIMGVPAAASLYTGEENAPRISTITDVLKPIEDGDSTISTDLTFLGANSNRFHVDLLAGHPAFAVIEDRLGAAWSLVKGRDKQGFRQTNWNTLLCRYLEDKYDLVLYDLGPSLGSINRSVLMGCEHFLTPLGSDVFSIIGVKNISSWLDNWIGDYKHSWDALKDAERTDLSERYGVLPTPAIIGGYVGYTVQQYITKSYGKERRATKAYESIIGSVDAEIHSALHGYYSPALTADPSLAKLGDIPHLYSLVPLAQKKAVPIHGLQSVDGLVGSQFSAVRDYKEMVSPIAAHLIANLGIEVKEKAA